LQGTVTTLLNPQLAPVLNNRAKREDLPITVYKVDVDNDASVREGIDRISTEIGPIDVLVNNAGIERMGRWRNFHSLNFVL